MVPVMSEKVRPQVAAKVEIDGQPINLATLGETIEAVVTSLKAGRGFSLFTLNMDHLVKLRSESAFREAYSRATFVTADGAPVVWLARRQGVALERTTGADLFVPLCEAAARAQIPVAFFGASQSSLEAAAARLRETIPGLDIRYVEAPAQGFDPTSSAACEAADRIAASGARLCFVALGAPKQEYFSDVMLRRHPGIGFLGVGAAIDFVSGEQVRAPALFQRTGLEWFWRLATNPRRMFTRYARCALTLASIALQDLRRRQAAPAVPSVNG